MTTADTIVALPTEAEYEAVEKIVSDAQVAVERMALRLNPNPRDESLSITSRPVTAADIGLLWSFLESVQLDEGAIRHDVENQLEPALGNLNSSRSRSEESA